MGANLIRMLLQRLDLEPPLFFAEELPEAFGPTLRQVVSLGLLKETSPSVWASCWGCGGHQVGRVEYISDTRIDRPRAYLPCHECGPVQIPFDQLRRWIIDVPGFLRALATAAAITGSATEIVPGLLWRLGKVRWAGRSREVFLARNLDAKNRRAVSADLGRHPKAVLFVPTEVQVHFWSASTPNLAVALESVLMLGAEGFHFDQEYLENRLVEEGLSGPTHPKRATKKRASRAANIEILVQEMRKHLKAAKDHAIETRDRKGIPELLPRPSQEQLAGRTGMKDYDVHRCLNDPAARELQLYWGVADNLDQILVWKSTRRGGRSKQ